MKRTPMPPRTARLARHTRIPRPTAPLPAESAPHRAGRIAQRAAYAAAPDAGQAHCTVCGQPGPTEHAHLFTQKQHPAHANNPLNWLVVGRYCGCHQLQENDKLRFAARYPEAHAQMLDQMQQVDPAAFASWAALHPELLEPAPPRGYCYLHELY